MFLKYSILFFETYFKRLNCKYAYYILEIFRDQILDFKYKLCNRKLFPVYLVVPLFIDVE